MVRTRVKICGITRPEDGAAAAACGVDAVGLMFRQDSKRYINEDCARRIVKALPPLVTRVGVFADADQAMVEEFLKVLPIDLLQFHGSEDPAFCEKFDRPYMKAIAASNREEIERKAADYASACAILIDSAHAGQFGGTGKVFDWSMIPEISQPLVLAGGLDPVNVGEAVKTVRPWAVDLSTGVESSKGIKDAEKIRRLMAEVANADAETE